MMLFVSTAVARGVYQQPVNFVNNAFNGEVPKVKYFWLTGNKNIEVKKILGHAYNKLRIKYWRKADEFVWILDEIGKEEPITVGIIIKNNSIKKLRVLVYRESRGEEVRHKFFTAQFQNAKINKKGKLDRSIDGITGATLSVRALTRLSRLALYLSSQLVK